MKRLSRTNTLLAFAFCSSIGYSAVAEENHSLSLKDAIERAMIGNADLRRERVTVAVAEARRITAEGQFDVLLDATLGIERQTVPTLSLCVFPLCIDQSAGRYTTTRFGLGLSRRLETGGTLKLVGSANRTDAVVSAGSDLLHGTFYRSNLALVFTHPLLRDFGTEVAEANLRKAHIQQNIAQLGRHMRACNVVRDVVLTYWELAYASQDLAIKRSAVDLAQEQLRITQAMIAAGRLADADAASVERAIAQRLEDLASSEQNLYFRSLDLQRLFGTPSDANTPLLAAADTPTTIASTVEEAAEIERALAANPQLRALRLGLGLSQIDIVTARNTLRPRLDFTGSVGPVGRKAELGDALKQVGGFSELDWSAGLVFELPVQNRAARGQMRMAEEELGLARLNADDFAVQVRDLVLRTTRSIRTSGKRVELGQREIQFAQQNLDSERARFQAGRATNNDVLLRQQELKDAETRFLRATVDRNESETVLSAVTGEVLDHFDVVLQGLP
jgi:outer membrane protein TolC